MRGEDLWNAWSHNYRRSEDGYITHVFSESRCRAARSPMVSLCGVRMQETGFIQLGEKGWYVNNKFEDTGWRPGCLKCLKILRKAGLVNERNEPVRDFTRDRAKNKETKV